MMTFALRSLFFFCGMSGLLTGAWSHPAYYDKGWWKLSSDCPKGWTQLTCHCYIYQDETRNFADAESVCNILGGNLVSIHSDLENAFVQELIRAGGNTDEVWIGLHDAIENDDFIWTDGSDEDFTNFASSEPDETGDCVELDESNGNWQDASCTDDLAYVCIRDVLHH
ncbi:galactose-specific lectin nattectin-like isoform X3 [Syngnathus scovelli]|uniref:galactose-specific lectin nattectin-like isoform X3 n=1 Tax=Syngnathus scovelli TaxID=161590 RepID=UPI0021101BFB|nr:galactose-specific lectin nattectin-like isoform X3 [Syngnathus scovelli]